MEDQNDDPFSLSELEEYDFDTDPNSVKHHEDNNIEVNSIHHFTPLQGPNRTVGVTIGNFEAERNNPLPRESIGLDINVNHIDRGQQVPGPSHFLQDMGILLPKPNVASHACSNTPGCSRDVEYFAGDLGGRPLTGNDENCSSLKRKISDNGIPTSRNMKSLHIEGSPAPITDRNAEPLVYDPFIWEPSSEGSSRASMGMRMLPFQNNMPHHDFFSGGSSSGPSNKAPVHEISSAILSSRRQDGDGLIDGCSSKRQPSSIPDESDSPFLSTHFAMFPSITNHFDPANLSAETSAMGESSSRNLGSRNSLNRLMFLPSATSDQPFGHQQSESAANDQQLPGSISISQQTSSIPSSSNLPDSFGRPLSSSGLSRARSLLLPHRIISSGFNDFGGGQSAAGSQDGVLPNNRPTSEETGGVAASSVSRPGPDAIREARQRMITEARNFLNLIRRGEPVRLADIANFDQAVLLYGGDLVDRHRDMRLDVDNMSYEELLALEERIGNVSTGLTEETIMKCMKQRKFVCLSSDLIEELEPCCICREDYLEGEDVGKLDCGHDFHTECIKKWLVLKNLCPICKTTALSTT